MKKFSRFLALLLFLTPLALCGCGGTPTPTDYESKTPAEDPALTDDTVDDTPSVN